MNADKYLYRIYSIAEYFINQTINNTIWTFQFNDTDGHENTYFFDLKNRYTVWKRQRVFSQQKNLYILKNSFVILTRSISFVAMWISFIFWSKKKKIIRFPYPIYTYNFIFIQSDKIWTIWVACAFWEWISKWISMPIIHA